jgi:hypothetical protein
MSFMGNLRRCASRRFYGIIRKQGKLVEMHLYQQAPAISLHAPSPAPRLPRPSRGGFVYVQSRVCLCFCLLVEVASRTSLFPKVEHFVNGRPERNFSMPKNQPGERGMITAMPADYIVRCDLV